MARKELFMTLPPEITGAYRSSELTYRTRLYTYDKWMKSVGIPIHRGYFIEDARTIELGWWEELGCKGAFIELAGQEGISGAWVTEVAPGKTLPPLKFALDEIVYVLDGRGLTTVWQGEGKPKKTFEWQKHSMFLLPHNSSSQMSNAQGDRPARLLHVSYIPIAMMTIQDPKFFFNNPYENLEVLYGKETEFYSEAKSIQVTADSQWGANWEGRMVWYGNFFPDLGAWDRLDQYNYRGAGGTRLAVQFPGSEMSCHMSVFPSRTYKKGHRHGPGVVIGIPAGEGYSIMWPEGKDKIVIPWHEASIFVPPYKWFHQHFNLGGSYARYLALHPPMQFAGAGERVDEPVQNQIEYPDEDPRI